MAISKKIRFEVFKRDSFTCQYCGRSAPDVVLQADHIEPRSKDGSDDILNLITSCFDCNSGKSDRSLGDDTVLTKRKTQLDRLQERREQIEMMMEWQKSLLSMEQDVAVQLADFWNEIARGHLVVNDRGTQNLNKWLRKYSLAEMMDAMRIAASQYLEFDSEGFATNISWERAFVFIPRICAITRKSAEKPYLRDLFYIRGILRNRFDDVDQWGVMPLLESVVEAGATIDEIRADACTANSYYQFRKWMESVVEEFNGEN